MKLYVSLIVNVKITLFFKQVLLHHSYYAIIKPLTFVQYYTKTIESSNIKEVSVFGMLIIISSHDHTQRQKYTFSSNFNTNCQPQNFLFLIKSQFIRASDTDSSFYLSFSRSPKLSFYSSRLTNKTHTSIFQSDKIFKHTVLRNTANEGTTEYLWNENQITSLFHLNKIIQKITMP